MGFKEFIDGKYYNMYEGEMKYQALSIAKDIHTSLAQLTFIEMLSVMSADNPAKKEVQALETKINDLTTEVGLFIQKYIPDVADAEAGDVQELSDQPDKVDNVLKQKSKDKK